MLSIGFIAGFIIGVITLLILDYILTKRAYAND
jgi:hypothetical protein